MAKAKTQTQLKEALDRQAKANIRLRAELKASKENNDLLKEILRRGGA